MTAARGGRMGGGAGMAAVAPGPARELERKLAELVPLKHFVATGFARNALYLLARALGWDAATEVIVPAFTCQVIRHALEAAGVTPVPVDAEPDGLNIDPDLVGKAVTGRTRAVYVVHTYGTAADMERICAVAKRHGLAVIEDVAHAPFYRYRGRQLGTWGDYAIYSFTKKMINFEGGAIGTNNAAAYEAMIRLRGELHRPGPPSAAGLIDSYVRLAGSWWESGFSPAALLLMKLNDLVNRAVFRGSYGFSVDPGKFMPAAAACRIALRALDALSADAGRPESRHAAFREGSPGAIALCPLRAVRGDTLPRYCTGAVTGGSAWLKLISFRTWRNANAPGAYPRADYLYAHYRIFSSAILPFARRWKRLPGERFFDTGYEADGSMNAQRHQEGQV